MERDHWIPADEWPHLIQRVNKAQADMDALALGGWPGLAKGGRHDCRSGFARGSKLRGLGPILSAASPR